MKPQAVRRPAAKVTRYRTTPTRTVRGTFVRTANTRLNRYSRVRPRYRYVTNFRPVMAVNSYDMPDGMVSPVENLQPTELQDSFYYRRPDGMIHYAIDIFRPIGDRLVAAVDGTIERLDPNPLGGTVVYLVDTERRFRFYYAHLSRHEEGLTVGQQVRAGDPIGYVGDTGNAKGTQPHLHFQISNLAGAVVNPYPWLSTLARQERETIASE